MPRHLSATTPQARRGNAKSSSPNSPDSPSGTPTVANTRLGAPRATKLLPVTVKPTTISRDELLMRAFDALLARPEHHVGTDRAVAYSRRFGHGPSRIPEDQDRRQGVQNGDHRDKGHLPEQGIENGTQHARPLSASDSVASAPPGQRGHQQIYRARRALRLRRATRGFRRVPQHVGRKATTDARGLQRLKVGVARELGVQRLKAPSRVEQERDGFPAVPQVQTDLSPQAQSSRLLERVERPAIATSAAAASGAPASCFASAAASARRARLAGSGDNVAARSRNAAAAATPPRAWARPAERSSSAATASSGPNAPRAVPCPPVGVI